MARLAKVLVGDDGTAGARRAVEEATELAAAVGAGVVALRVVGAHDDAGQLSVELERRCRETAREHGVDCDCMVVTGDPRDALLHEVVHVGADVVVVGDTGHWTLARPHLGSVAGHLAHHSPRPVVVVPDAARPLDDGHVVVGIDGSPGSEAALDWAAEVASRAGASVIAAHFHDPMADSYPHPPDASEWRTHVEPKVRAMVERLHQPGADVEVSFRGSHRVEGLLELAGETDAAMIVVGARGHASFHRLLLGGTAIELLHHSDRPVGVVPLGRAEAVAA